MVFSPFQSPIQELLTAHVPLRSQISSRAGGLWRHSRSRTSDDTPPNLQAIEIHFKERAGVMMPKQGTL